MKKLVSVLFVLFLLAGITLAQHTDIVTQSGNSNNSTVDQGFMASPGPGLPGNEAYVDQIGNNNISDVDQYNGGFAGDQHYAKVYSTGNSNYAKVFQERAAGGADVYQSGNSNWAEIFQSGNFGTSTAYTPNIDAYAHSIGNSNVIKETMWGTNATAFSLQVGNSNRIDQIMGSGYNEKVENSDFEASQFGNNNTAYQLMEGDGSAGVINADNNFGSIYTSGNSNYARQLMTEESFPEAANNTAYASQSGDNNWSDQLQTGNGNTSAHNQSGNGNVSTTNQN